MTAEKLKEFFKNKTVRIVIICVLALVLLLVSYFVFAKRGKEQDGYARTEREERLVLLLEKLDDVDGATVMVTEEDGVPVSAIVFFEGTDGLLVRMHILEISAAALGIDRSNVHIYASA